MKTALVYDRVNKWGGAERVLLALHELFPQATLFTSVHDKKRAPWADVFEIKTSFLQKFPHIVKNHEMYPYLMPLAFEGFNFDTYDLVISLTSESAKGILTRPETKHICYCLTPTRYLWSGYNEYFKNPALKTAAAPIVKYLRKWDQIAAARPDTMVAISKEVQDRVKTYYDRDAAIIYPPVSLGAGDWGIGTRKQKNNKKDSYFLIVSRLSKFTQYKRIDLAIEACNELKLPLKIIGNGSWENELASLAGPTVEFLGTKSDSELSTYYANCRALIFPGVEDFGLTVVEAQGFGKPVIAYRRGGAMETIKDGKTGIFFEEQSKKALITALKVFDKKSFDPQECRDMAENFSKKRFKDEFTRLVQRMV